MLPAQAALIETLYRAHYRQLLRYAIAVLHDEHRAEELVQDTFHEAINHIDKVMAHPAPQYWLRQTLTYKIKNSERTRMRDLRRLLSLDATGQEPPAGPTLLEDEVAERLSPTVTAAAQIQTHLTPDELHHLKRLTLDKASHWEVSQELGISVWTSQKRLERIRKKLRGLLPK